MDADPQNRSSDYGQELPKIQEVGPRDHGWRVLMHASERQANALKQAMDDGRVFATDAELDDFLKVHE